MRNRWKLTSQKNWGIKFRVQFLRERLRKEWVKMLPNYRRKLTTSVLLVWGHFSAIVLRKQLRKQVDELKRPFLTQISVCLKKAKPSIRQDYQSVVDLKRALCWPLSTDYLVHLQIAPSPSISGSIPYSRSEDCPPLTGNQLENSHNCRFLQTTLQ